MPLTIKEGRRYIHREDLAWIDSAFANVERSGGSWSAEYRVVYPPNHTLSGETRWIALEGTVLRNVQGLPFRMLGIARDVSQRKEAERRQRVLLGELDHRVKNTLATVSAIASRTRETSSSMDDFVGALDGRIRSMATTHELLSLSQWQGLSLGELVRRELAPYVAGNTEIEGPEVTLTAEAGQVLAMVLHELVTNAAKHGALSTKHGLVWIRWDWQLNGGGRLNLQWQESGGPEVVAPKTSGYGTSVIRSLVPYELGGAADLTFNPEGARCHIEIPVHWFALTDFQTGRSRSPGSGPTPPGPPSTDAGGLREET